MSSPDLPVHRRELPTDASLDDVVETILGVVRDATETSEPLDGPLYETVDTEALARLHRHSRATIAPMVYFVVAECDVLLSSDGQVLARHRGGLADCDPSRPDDFASLVDALDGA